MKKLGLFIMPLMAASFLVGCGGNTPTPPGPTPTEGYNFIFDGKKHCTANNLSKYENDAKVNFTITANDGYVLPNATDTTKIKVEGLGADKYTYTLNKDEKTATFSCTMPANTVKVTIDPEILYTFTFAGTNCTANNKEGYKEGTNVSFAITADNGYVLPNSITVKGVTSSDYQLAADKTSAVFTCTMPKGAVTVAVTASEPEPDSYTFEFTHSGCNTTHEFEEKYEEGEQITFTITAETDYLLPETIDVTGVSNYTYIRDTDKKSATFTCTMPASNVSVKVIATYTPPASEYVMTFVGTNCTADNANSYIEGAEVEFTITAKSGGYTLPETIDVTGVSNYTYTPNGTTATFTCTMPKGAVTVTVKAVDPIPTHSFTFTGEHCSVSPTPKAKYEEGEQISFTITAEDDYALPSSITVSGVTSYNYVSNRTTATFSCTMATNDITVEVGAVSMYHQFIFTGQHCTIQTGPSSYKEGTIVYLTITANTDYELPTVDKVEVEGLATFNSTNYVLSEDKLTAVLSFVMPQGDVMVKVEAAKPLYTFHFDGTNCKGNDDYEYIKSDAMKGDIINVTIVPDEGFVLPSKTDITVTGVTAYTYTISGGNATFACTMPGNNVDVIVTATEATPIQMPDYLCFTCKSDTGTLSYAGTTREEFMLRPTLEYSKDGKNWMSITYLSEKNVPVEICELEKDESVYIRGSNPAGLSYDLRNCVYFVTSAESDFAVSGDIMSLLYKDDFITKDTVPAPTTFACLFKNCNISDASELVLPGLPSPDCYQMLFYFCTKLTDAGLPAINATTLSQECCYCMFQGCTNLATIPNDYLSDYTTLAPGCYEYMFANAPIVSAPELPAEELEERCYFGMFYNTALVTAPALPATICAKQCYYSMFDGCSSLVNAPELPAETLADQCYYSMFEDCSSLVNAPELPAETLAALCYCDMFWGCSALTESPELPAEVLADRCYEGMFTECSNLVIAPALPATTLIDGCYKEMFRLCSKLIVCEDAVGDEYIKFFECPSGDLPNYCVYEMFNNNNPEVKAGHSYYYKA